MSEFLPGTIGQRLAELREQRGLTREELAERVGVSTSTLSRLESGQIQKFSDEMLTALAREFDVSTDFLLGLTNIPDRMNYDIGELGLTALAARNLYTGKVNNEVVSRMLEHPRFAVLTTMIAQFLMILWRLALPSRTRFLPLWVSCCWARDRERRHKQQHFPRRRRTRWSCPKSKTPLW